MIEEPAASAESATSGAGSPRPFRLRDLGLKLVVSYGAGVDSTAVLVGLWRRGVRPDVIVFADTGSEMPETYDYLPIIDAWLARVGFPALTIVKNRSPLAGHTSLEDNCLKNETLPSQAFRGGKPGGGACSAKWKHEPMDRWLLAQGIERRVRAIGYDAGAQDTRRSAKGSTESKKHTRDVFWYPLQAWGWDRARCEAEIQGAGLPVPHKSACFFCPAMKKPELRAMALAHPGLLRRAIRLEREAIEGKHTERRKAEGKKVSVLGLGRSFSWESFAREEKLLAEYGGPADSPDATDLPLPATQAFLAARTIAA
jgi:hypothetical protein